MIKRKADILENEKLGTRAQTSNIFFTLLDHSIHKKNAMITIKKEYFIYEAKTVLEKVLFGEGDAENKTSGLANLKRTHPLKAKNKTFD